MNQPSVEAFRFAAEEFCTMAEDDRPLTRNDLWKIRELLIRLIFHVPSVESHQHGAAFNGKRIENEKYGIAVKRFGELPFNFYRVVFDPHDFDAMDEPVTGMLADDLSDIYRDLAEGLDNARSGHLDEACFDWSQSYMVHWARHAVNALSAIEIYRTYNYLKVDPPLQTKADLNPMRFYEGLPEELPKLHFSLVLHRMDRGRKRMFGPS